MSDIRYISNYTGEAIDSAISKAQKLPSIAAANSGQILTVSESELQTTNFSTIFNNNYDSINGTIIDSTLTQNGKAANAKITGEKFHGVEQTLGIDLIYQATFESGYISTAANGSIMSFDRTTNADWVSAIIPVIEGDKITLTVTGTGTNAGTGGYAYAIIQSNQTVISKSSQNATLTDAVIIMPAHAAYLVVNNKLSSQANYYAVKGETDQIRQIAEDTIEEYSETILATKNELNRVDNNISLANRQLDDIWAYGTIDGSNGIKSTASLRRRRTMRPCGVLEGIYSVDAQNTDYSFFVFAYRRSGSSIYVGAWDSENQTWIKSTTGFTAIKYFDFSIYPEYKFQLVLCKDNNNYIYAKDQINVSFNISPVNSNIIKINNIENILNDVTSSAVIHNVNTYHISNDDRSDVNVINGANIRSELISYGDYGTIAGTANGSTCYYIQVDKDSVIYVNTNHSPCTLRTSIEQPVKSTSAVWSGQISRTMPTYEDPWVVLAGNYVTLSVEQGFEEDEYADICVAPLGYGLSNIIKEQISKMVGNTNYGTVSNFMRASEVYAAFDKIEATSGNRMTHTIISENLDTDDPTPIRAYVIDVSPKRMDFSFHVQNEPFYNKPQILITATIHGNERGNVCFLLDFVNNLLNNQQYSEIAGQFEWHIIPIVNIWGFNHTMTDDTTGEIVWYYIDSQHTSVTIHNNTDEYRGGIRLNEDGIDINRDFSDANGFNSLEARTVRDYFLTLTRLIATIDLHQWWNANRLPTVVGMSSMVPDQEQYISKYHRCWSEMSAGAKEAEDIIREVIDNYYTKYQMVFLWGSETESATIRSKTARGYFAGVSGNTEHQNYAIPFSSTFESSMNTRFLTNTTVPYHPISLMTGNIFTQKMLLAIGRAALKEFLDFRRNISDENN